MRLDGQSRHPSLRAGRSSGFTRATSGSRARSNFKAAGANSGSRVTTHILFFHDEAVSFAAGHRPCAECRRESYDLYRAAWAPGARGRGAIGEADEPAAPWRADRPWEPPPAHSRDAVGRASRGGLSAAWRIAGRDRRRPSQPMDAGRAIAAAGRVRRRGPRPVSRRRRLSPRCEPDTPCRLTTARACELQHPSVASQTSTPV